MHVANKKKIVQSHLLKGVVPLFMQIINIISNQTVHKGCNIKNKFSTWERIIKNKFLKNKFSTWESKK